MRDDLGCGGGFRRNALGVHRVVSANVEEREREREQIFIESIAYNVAKNKEGVSQIAADNRGERRLFRSVFAIRN